MPTKPLSELIQPEVTLLAVAARLLAALRERTARPPPPSMNDYWGVKTKAELVRPSVLI
jgi:hypothetical protein